MPQPDKKQLEFVKNLLSEMELIIQEWQDTDGASSESPYEKSKTGPSFGRFNDFKSKYFENKDGKKVFKDYVRLSKYEDFAELYELFEKEKLEAGKYNFDDMILEVKQKMQTDPDFLMTVQEKYQYILVDEFQDTNGSQLAILEALCSNPLFEGNPEIMVVGDPDQAIYRFQGAVSNNILYFMNKYPKCTVVDMHLNYRSKPKIVNLANQIIHQSKDRVPKKDIISAESITNQ